MKIKIIPSSWVSRVGRRLDPGPYLSDGLEYRMRLDRLALRKDRLIELTENGKDGIFIAPYFKRNYVDDPEHGVPLLGNTDILMSNPLLTASFIPKKTYEQLQEGLQLKSGWTLITCFGTVGNMAYCRLDMESCAGSTNFMRVVPDSRKVLSGYLYAFLSSKFGRALITQSETGSVIPNLLPSQIADLPVPRLGDAIEQRAHALVEEAACGRSQSAKLRKQAIQNLYDKFRLDNIEQAPTSTNFATFAVQISRAQRFDAAHHHPACVHAANELATTYKTTEQLGNVASVFTPGIFKRIHVDDPNYGYPYFSGSELFQYAPDPRGHLSRKAPNIKEYLVHTNWLLIQDAGQLGGLIGRLVRVGVDIDSSVVSNHLMRIVPRSLVDAAYLFALLISPHGYRAITRHAFGTSIPQLDPKHIETIKIPWPDEILRKQIAQPIIESWELEDSAVIAEREAIRLVEQEIEEAA